MNHIIALSKDLTYIAVQCMIWYSIDLIIRDGLDYNEYMIFQLKCCK